MPNLQAQEVLDKLEEDSDWNETDEEVSSGSEVKNRWKWII